MLSTQRRRGRWVSAHNSLSQKVSIPEFFPAIACGDKNFEVRVNDRDFKTGDISRILQEWDNGYTREAVTKIVTYTLDGGRFGVQDGWTRVMGLRDYSPV